MTRKRETWVDISRGIAILLVILGHLPLKDDFHYIIYSFHMPLFFMISGFYIISYPLLSFRKYTNSKFKRLLIPYLIFGLLLMIPYGILLQSFRTHTDIDFNLIHAYCNGIIGHIFGLRSDWAYCGTYWFLPCLFTAAIMLHLITKYVPKYTVCFIIIFPLLGFCYQYFVGRSLPLSVDLAFIAILFLYIGNKYYHKINRFGWKLSIVFGILGLLCSVFNGKVEMYSGEFNNPILFLLSGIGLSIFVLKVCSSVRGLPVVQWLGCNTVLIYMLHYLLRPIISYIIVRLPYNDYWLINIVYCSLGTVIICSILYPIIQIINKYFPVLIGRNI